MSQIGNSTTSGSQISLGIRNTSINVSGSGERTTVGSVQVELPPNSVSLILYCMQHRKIYMELARKDLRLYRLPFRHQVPSKSSTDQLLDICKTAGIAEADIYNGFIPREDVRIQFPNGIFRNHDVYTAAVTRCPCKASDPEKFRWIPFEGEKDVKIWGYEVERFLKAVKEFLQISAKYRKTTQEPPRLELDHCWRDVTLANEWQFVSSQVIDEEAAAALRQPGNKVNVRTQMLLEAGIAQPEAEKLHYEFLNYLYPSCDMTEGNFIDFFKRHLPEEVKAQCDTAPYSWASLFAAFDFKFRGAIKFATFLQGLAACSAALQHRDQFAEARVSYIFRLFDVNRDKKLSPEELLHLINTAREQNSDRQDRSSPEKDPRLALYGWLKVNVGPLDVDQVTRLAGAQQLRGLSRILRIPLKESLLDKPNRRSRMSQSGTEKGGLVKSTKCKADREIVRVNPIVTIYDSFENRYYSEPGEEYDESVIPRELILVHSPPLQLISFIKDFFRNNRKRWVEHSYDPDYWELQGTALRKNGNGLIETIRTVCKMVSKILEKEPSCLDVASPCMVLGDLHGNLHDLLVYGKAFWPGAPHYLPHNLLFLGDYVDRGAASFMVALYLFCLKITNKDRVFLLRGNHEIRAVQDQFSYHKELIALFGDALGEEMFGLTNAVFDRLPIAGVVGKAVFCAHGGIPTNANKIAELRSEIQRPLSDPDNCKPAWEMMWNDPLDAEEFSRVILPLKFSAQQLFSANIKRSTAFYWGPKAAKRFHETNALSATIRAHEATQEGYAVTHGGETLTVFSSSRYNKKHNDATVALVSDEEIRLYVVKTFSEEEGTSVHHTRDNK